jgi:predicted DNA-binding transcriptional regulator YafY
MKSLIQRLRRLDHLIRHRGTGSPATLAKKIGISERSLYDYLKLLKDMGAPVTYSRDAGSYYYKEHGSFHIAFLEYNSFSETDNGHYEENSTAYSVNA